MEKKIRYISILLLICVIGFSCSPSKDDTTKINEAIENSLLENLNNPDSYEFDQIRFLDTLYVRDAYLHEIENLKDEVNSEKSLIQSSKRQIKEQEVPELLSTLREEFRVYGVNNQFDKFKNVIALYEQNNPSWIDSLSELEREIKGSVLQEMRYRNELPLFEELNTIGRNNLVQNDIIASSNERVKSLNSSIKELEQFIESNEENMNEIAFFRILYSYREENLFGGIQLMRKVYEIRFKNEKVELMWESENFESIENVAKAIIEPTFGKGIEIIKKEKGLV